MTETEWYWSLTRQMAVPADQRDKADEVLGPYPSEAAARNWKDTVENRNESWDEADEAWSGDPDEPDA